MRLVCCFCFSSDPAVCLHYLEKNCQSIVDLCVNVVLISAVQQNDFFHVLFCALSQDIE